MEMAVLFLRKSDENAEADDFDIQEDITRAYAASKGYGVYAVYREAHSGKHSPLTRTVLRQAINDIKSGRAQVMVIRSYDRLARTIEQTYHILFEIEQMYHGRVEAAQEQLDRDSPVAKIQFAVMAAASEMERDRIFERLQAGKAKRAARGHLMGGPNPRFGYVWVDDEPGKRTTYAVNPETAPIVQRIFSLAAQGMSVRAIARELNKDSVITPSSYAVTQRDAGKRHVAKYWHAEPVRTILTDERYAGKPVAYRWKTGRKARDGREVTTRIRSEQTIALPVETWPALITPEQFALAQTHQQTNVAGRKPLLPAIMRGHVRCGLCGRKMTVASYPKRTPKYAYVCRHRGGDGAPQESCGYHSMGVHAVDELGWNAVKYLLVSREKFVALLRERFAPVVSDGGILAAAAGALREKQEELATLAGSIGLTTNAVVRQSIIGQMETVSEQVQKLEAQYQEVEAVANNEKAAEAYIETLLNRIYSWVGDTFPADGFPIDEQLAQLDVLPFDVKRAAVEASGVNVALFPAGYLQTLGMPEEAGRVLVTFQHTADLASVYGLSLNDPVREIDNNNLR